jgi:hypothetical protein
MVPQAAVAMVTQATFAPVASGELLKEGGGGVGPAGRMREAGSVGAGGGAR